MKINKIPIYTASEAAIKLGVAYSTITLHARKLGIARRGRDYLFTEADIKALRQSLAASVPGRPRKTEVRDE